MSAGKVYSGIPGLQVITVHNLVVTAGLYKGINLIAYDLCRSGRPAEARTFYGSAAPDTIMTVRTALPAAGT